MAAEKKGHWEFQSYDFHDIAALGIYGTIISPLVFLCMLTILKLYMGKSLYLAKYIIICYHGNSQGWILVCLPHEISSQL